MLAQAKSVVRALLSNHHRRRRLAELRGSRAIVTASDLDRDIAALGIRSGDTVMLHASLKSIGYVDGGPRTVLRALIDAVGPSGTLVVPTYWLPGGTILATCGNADYVFDPRRHGTHLGSLPAAFLGLDGIARSVHPTHSVSAIGRHAHRVVDDHHRAPSIFGAGSPWQRCLELDAKVLGLGISMGPVTFYHLLEDELGDAFPLPVRSRSSCWMPCRDPSGGLVQVPVAPLVPAYMTRRIDAPGRDDLRAWFADEFVRAGLMTLGPIGEAASWFIPARSFHRHLSALMARGITIYSTADELAAADRARAA